MITHNLEIVLHRASAAHVGHTNHFWSLVVLQPLVITSGNTTTCVSLVVLQPLVLASGATTTFGLLIASGDTATSDC